MVSIKKIEQIITKIINNKIIVKCGRLISGKKSSLHNLIRKALFEFKDNTISSDKEHIGLIKNNGEIIFTKKGKPNKVTITKRDLIENDLMDEYDLHMTHNHITPAEDIPKDSGEVTCLSEDNDLLNFLTKSLNNSDKYLIKSVTADCHNGSRMTLKRNVEDFNHDNFKKASSNLHMNWSIFLFQSENIVNTQIVSWAKNYYISNNKLPSNEEFISNKIHFEEKFAKDNFIDYIQENIDEFKNIGFELSAEWIK